MGGIKGELNVKWYMDNRIRVERYSELRESYLVSAEILDVLKIKSAAVSVN